MAHSKIIVAMLFMAICLLGILPLTVYAENNVYVQEFPQRYNITSNYPIQYEDQIYESEYQVSLSQNGAFHIREGYYISDNTLIPVSETNDDFRLGAFSYDNVVINEGFLELTDNNARISYKNAQLEGFITGHGVLKVIIPKDNNVLSILLSSIGVTQSIDNACIVNGRYYFDDLGYDLESIIVMPFSAIDYFWYLPIGQGDNLAVMDESHAEYFMRYFEPTQKTEYVTQGYTDIYNVVHRYIAHLNEIEWIRLLSSIVLATSVILGIVLLIKNIFIMRR